MKRNNVVPGLDYENIYSAYPDNKEYSSHGNETIEATSYEDSLFAHLSNKTANSKHFNESKTGKYENRNFLPEAQFRIR